jgi:hypothetical protein
VLECWTARQLAAAVAWLREEWNKPSRTDHYLMQLAASQSGKGGSLDKWKIKFTFRAAQPAPQLSAEEVSEIAKTRWFARVGYQPQGQAAPPDRAAIAAAGEKALRTRQPSIQITERKIQQLQTKPEDE